MKKIYYTLIMACILCSCNDFVDIVPKGNTIPSTVDDLAKMMNNGSMATGGDAFEIFGITAGTFYLEVYSDDYVLSENPESALYQAYLANTSIMNTLKWGDYIYGLAQSDYNWDNMYHSNYIANYVLDNIDKVEEGTAYRRDEVKGQALVHRAMNYFLLVNLYGKQYKAVTAETDLGVPLVLEADINKQYPRATVAEVYTQMLGDLDEAIGLLKTEVPKFNNQPGLATAYALRARYRLWMQNYDEAYDDAVSALDMRSEMIDYNHCAFLYPGMPTYGLSGYDMVLLTNPEVMYSRFVSEHCKCSYSAEMLALIDKEKDLRYQLFIASMPAYGYLEEVAWNKHLHSGIDVSEVWLMKAEAALRKSKPDMQEALAALNEVRRHRYVVATYQPYAETNPDLLLREILNERRRELIYTEMSFLDKKRLNADPKTAAPMSRTYLGETYTMPVDDPHWQLAIPLNVMALNPLLEQNQW